MHDPTPYRTLPPQLQEGPIRPDRPELWPQVRGLADFRGAIFVPRTGA